VSPRWFERRVESLCRVYIAQLRACQVCERVPHSMLQVVVPLRADTSIRMSTHR